MKKITFLLLLAFLAVSSASAIVSENLYVVGNACSSGWDPGRALEMTKTSDGVFTWTGVLSSTPSDARFKFLMARSWDTSVTCQITTPGHKVITSGMEEDLFVRTNSGADNAFQVSETAEYTVTVDLNTMKMLCTKAGVVNTDTPDLTQLYLVGDATTAGWSSENALTMAKVADGVFEWAGNLTADGEFKFLNIKGSWNRTINPLEANINFVVGTEYSLFYRQLEASPNDFKFKVTTAGLYSIQVDLNLMKVTITNATPDLSQLYIVGSATTAAWESANALEMTRLQYGVFNWTGDLTADGEFKFLNKKGSWSKTINPVDADTYFMEDTEYSLNYRPMESDPNDYKFKVTTSGKFDITVNLNSMKINIKQSTNSGVDKLENSDLIKKVRVSERAVHIIANSNDIIQSAGIFDIAGKCLNSVQNINTTVVLSDNLANGIYIMKISCNNKQYVQKVIIR